MNEEVENIDELIGNVLAGEASAEEKAKLELWIQQRPENKKYFEQIKFVFEKSSSTAIQLQVDTDVAWQKVKEKLKHSTTPSIGYWNVLKIAAGVVWLGILVFMFFQNKQPKEQTLAIATDKQTQQDTLPDGSMAFVNKKSKVVFKYDPVKKIRSVKLQGEAYFNVRHEVEKPFIIEANEIIIKDIGTAFNVKAYPETSTIEVTVASGEVQFYTTKNPGLNLKAGEKGIYDKSLKQFSKLMKADTNVLAYKTKVLTFSNADLQSVITSLNDVYDTKISLANDVIKRCRLTVNFNNDRLETIIDVIAETLHLTVIKSGDEIIFSGSGCTN